ncbi:MAG TPA: glucosyl-3-phosphoglycerate synthase [Solirubrobacterales bacterium]|nr:glucosyl-3-phosphoglycerate synthase [Solirubrobacterales bacterium]
MLATFDHSQFDLSALLALKRGPVTVCVPTRETAATIAQTIRTIDGLRSAGLVDQVLVIDADSADGTAAVAEAAGAEVFQEAALLPEFGPVEGKGDAMWRALSVASGEIVAYLDGDVRDFGPHYVTGLLGPLLQSPQIEFVKGFYRRPLVIDSMEIEDGGGRVTELTAKPLLDLLVPELASFRQPLAGECAARRSLLAGIPYSTGYGVEIAMLVEVWKRVGIERMAQVDLGTKRNSHQSLTALAGMSREVIDALVQQLETADTPCSGSIEPAAAWLPKLHERPPMESVAPLASPASQPR